MILNKLATFGFIALLAVSPSIAAHDDPPATPAPQKEHDWLKQLAGEWESDAEIHMEPGKPPVKSKGTESGRMLGGFWLIADGKSEVMGMPFTNVFTLGYDAEKKKYVGTWVDSMGGYLWKYEGSVDASGKILTLDTDGPCPLAPGKTSKFKETIELKSKDNKYFTSSIQGDDGKWTTLVTVNSRRKAAPATATTSAK